MIFSELCKKEVINVNDGCCLGNTADMIFDERNGCIREIIIPGPAKWFGCMGRSTEYHIPWSSIVRIGPDIVLVDVCENEVRRSIPPQGIGCFFV
jgi:YlmC/YmxH family sporulation protein